MLDRLEKLLLIRQGERSNVLYFLFFFLLVSAGMAKRGGMYSWIVHSRDVNEDLLLGDFNHGSLSKPVVFSVND